MSIIGPRTKSKAEGYITAADKKLCTDHHEAISTYCYRCAVKAHAPHILVAHIRAHLQPLEEKKGEDLKEPPSFRGISQALRSEDHLNEAIPEAAASSYEPTFHDNIANLLQVHYPTLALDQLQAQDQIVEREYGDDFAFSVHLAEVPTEPVHGC